MKNAVAIAAVVLAGSGAALFALVGAGDCRVSDENGKVQSFNLGPEDCQAFSLAQAHHWALQHPPAKVLPPWLVPKEP